MEDLDRRKLLTSAAAMTVGLLSLSTIPRESSAAVKERTNVGNKSVKGTSLKQSGMSEEGKVKLSQGVEKNDSVKVISDPASGIQAGERPFFRDDAWEIVVKRFQQLFPKFDAKNLNKALSEKVFDIKMMALDHHFAFASEVEDSAFSPFHVEDLLNQASNLLERALQLRDEWNEKAIKSFSFASDVLEFISLDEIHQKEIEAGFYTLPFRQSSAESDADEMVWAASAKAASLIQHLMNSAFSWEDIERISGNHQLLAWLAHIPGFQYPNHGEPLKNIWNEKPDTNANHALNAAAEVSYHALKNDEMHLQVQHATLEGARDASDAKHKASSARSKWDHADIEFRRMRTEMARQLGDLKIKAFTDEGGALNIAEQMTPIKKRFDNDFRDALARLSAAAHGMNLLYGYSSALSPSLQQLLAKSHTEDQTSADYFNDSLIWVRNATAWLVRFSQRDQNYVLALSLKMLIGQAEWHSAEKTAIWHFELTEDLFPGQRHVRLRGLSVSVEPGCNILGRKHKLWRAKVEAPKQSFVRHMSNSISKLDQSLIPPCWIGRATSRDNYQSPDINGVLSLHNVSPLGQWKLSLSSADSASLGDIDDIYLDLHLAVRSSTEGLVSP